MPETKLMTGRDLGKAICSHFGLNINQVQSDYRIKTEPDGLASINLTISLTADDLAGIARAAGGDGFRVEGAKWAVRISEEKPRSTNGIDPGFMAPPHNSTRDIDPGFAAPPHNHGACIAPPEFYKGRPDATAALSPEAKDTLRRYSDAWNADPRIDEIVGLLKTLVEHAGRQEAAHHKMAKSLICVSSGV